MKFVFDRAVKGRREGHSFFLIEPFEGSGPWDRMGVEFTTPEDWLEHVKKLGRALGIVDCECSILPSDDLTQRFIFSFQNETDYIAFMVATKGDIQGEFRRDITFSSRAERDNAIPKIQAFLKQNEITADLRTDVKDGPPNAVRVTTTSIFDSYTLVHAAYAGIFATKAQSEMEIFSRAPERSFF